MPERKINLLDKHNRPRIECTRQLKSVLGERFGAFKPEHQGIMVNATQVLMERPKGNRSADALIRRNNTKVFHSLAWLDQRKILEKLLTARVRTFASIGKDALSHFLHETLPPNLLHDHINEIVALHRKFNETIKTVPPGKRSLFHATKDTLTTRILTGGFKKADEHQRSNIGTGPFERHLGLKGIFTNCGRPYYSADIKFGTESTTDIFVFPETCLSAPHTICIKGESSLGFLYEDSEVADSFLYDSFQELDRQAGQRTPSGMRLKEAGLATILKLLSHHIMPPERVYPEDSIEVCLDIQEAGLPSMLLVGSEPEYYHEQAAEYWPEFAAKVPIIDLEKILQGRGEASEEVAKFVYRANTGTEDLNQLRYRPSY